MPCGCGAVRARQSVRAHVLCNAHILDTAAANTPLSPLCAQSAESVLALIIAQWPLQFRYSLLERVSAFAARPRGDRGSYLYL